MTATTTKPTGTNKWLRLIFILLLLIAFFLPWVTWMKFEVSGYQMPLGEFFAISKENFKLGNPFPQMDLFLPVLWLIPFLAIIAILLVFGNRKNALPAVISAMTALALATIYVLFTRTLLDLGVGTSLREGLNFGLYLTAFAAAGTIIASMPRAGWLAKILLIILGPLIAWTGFYFSSKYLEKQEFGDTATLKEDHVINAIDLIREFAANDSLANAKYREKTILVNGRVSEVQQPNDSTVNIQINDTTGSYAIFTLQKEYAEAAKTIKSGDSISIKGSCSGGIFSEILGTEFITFKRCAIIKN